ncbi:MAG TPA: GNAT family N-acetyltransferase [Candidatus Baltobacteraceae bacterium]|nr:GNAT family N-acetyltransferase [Candidatus Baltobacteraceae bacterium]
MPLSDGYHDLPPGKLASVVTCLEMRSPAPQRPERAGSSFTIERVVAPDAEWYRALFRRVGAEYLWASRLVLNDEQLLGIVRDENVRVYRVLAGSDEAGLLELDFRTPHECELVFFGVADPYVGSGAGRVMMNFALREAWSQPIERFWVHTCTLDHPRAIDFYIRSGFVPYKRQVEIGDDPRVIGLLPRACAPAVPVL